MQRYGSGVIRAGWGYLSGLTVLAHHSLEQDNKPNLFVTAPHALNLLPWSGGLGAGETPSLASRETPGMDGSGIPPSLC